MKFLLLVYLSFHFEGGATSSQSYFTNLAECEAARTAILQAVQTPNGDGWRWQRLVAVCVRRSES